MKQAISKVLEPSLTKKTAALGSCGFWQKERLSTTVSVVNQLTKQHIFINRPNQQAILVKESSCSKWQFFSIICVYFTNLVVRRCYPNVDAFSRLTSKTWERLQWDWRCAWRAASAARGIPKSQNIRLSGSGLMLSVCKSILSGFKKNKVHSQLGGKNWLSDELVEVLFV